MAKPLKTEEQLKADIFNVYSKCREEQSSDRRQVYFGQLCDSVFRWCTSYIFSETNEMGVEIIEALERIVKKENKTPKEETDFFKYLVTSLKNARAQYYRNNRSNIIKLPRIIFDMERMILLQESNAGRMLSEEDKIECISKWFNIPPKKARKYLEMIDNKNVSSLTSFDDDKEIAIPDSYNEPESAFFSKFNAFIIRESVESVLLSKQDRTRECYRALFTAYCIDNSIDFERAASVFNTEILEKYLKDGKKYNQYEIYLKYHPEVTKDSAEVRASMMLKKFMSDLVLLIKEKNHNTFS